MKKQFNPYGYGPGEDTIKYKGPVYARIEKIDRPAGSKFQLACLYIGIVFLIAVIMIQAFYIAGQTEPKKKIKELSAQAERLDFENGILIIANKDLKADLEKAKTAATDWEAKYNKLIILGAPKLASLEYLKKLLSSLVTYTKTLQWICENNGLLYPLFVIPNGDPTGEFDGNFKQQ